MGTDATDGHGAWRTERLGAWVTGAVLALGLVLGFAPAAGARTSIERTAASSSSFPARRLALQAYRHDRWLRLYRPGHHARHELWAHASVVGGVQRSIEEAPWQVAVFAEFEFNDELWGLICGGSIVDMNDVVTAGHCTYDPFTGQQLPADDFAVLAGASRITEEEIRYGATVEGRLVSYIRRHPDFDYAAGPGTPDDVAVLDLKSALAPSAAVRAIALPSSPAGPAEGSDATFFGFGAENTSASEINGNLYSLTSSLAPARRCGGEAEAVFLCASNPDGTACSGDSGGGLVESSDGAPTLIGVVDTVQTSGGQHCPAGALDGFANVTAPEIRDFIEGSEDPPLAPRGEGVSMHGVFTVGHEVTCEPGSWRNDPTFAYAFVDSADEHVLQQGASPSLVLSEADVGATISCHMEATNAGGTARVRTEAYAPVQAAPPSGNGGGGGNGNGGGNGGGSSGGGTGGGNGGGSGGSGTGTGGGSSGGGSGTGGDGGGGTSTNPAVTSAPGPGTTSESARGGVLGYHSADVGTAEIAALLRKEIVPHGGSARSATLLSSPRYTLAFRALEAGTAVVEWYALPSGRSTGRGRAKPVLIGTGRVGFAKAGTGKLVIELTAAGRRTLRSGGSRRCTAEGTFTPRGGGPVVAVRPFTLRG